MLPARVILTALILLSGMCQSSRGAPPPAEPAAPKPITAPLTALSTNPNYFTDGTGKAVYLTGSHTWNTFQDWGTEDTIRPLDFTAS